MKAEKSYTYQLFNQVMKWADKYRTLGVRTNADSPTQSKAAIALGAEGIGLCRTEHMFFEGDRITYMREMILAPDETARKKALKKLLPFQRKDFNGLFKAMDGRPVTVRLLDPPLHEFLPHDDEARRLLADHLGVSVDVVTSVYTLCTKKIQCLDTAVADSAFPIRKSRKCRPEPSSKQPPKCLS